MGIVMMINKMIVVILSALLLSLDAKAQENLEKLFSIKEETGPYKADVVPSTPTKGAITVLPDFQKEISVFVGPDTSTGKRLWSKKYFYSNGMPLRPEGFSFQVLAFGGSKSELIVVWEYHGLISCEILKTENAWKTSRMVVSTDLCNDTVLRPARIVATKLHKTRAGTYIILESKTGGYDEIWLFDNGLALNKIFQMDRANEAQPKF